MYYDSNNLFIVYNTNVGNNVNCAANKSVKKAQQNYSMIASRRPEVNTSKLQTSLNDVSN